MPDSRTPSVPRARRAAVALLASLLGSTAALASAAAQYGVPRAEHADSALRARGLAGSARVAFDASTARVDGGTFTTYGVSAGVLPFVSEHVQIGLAPTYGGIASPPSSAHNYGVAGTANYVFGGGTRWRGYAGGYASTANTSGIVAQGTLGAQAGALFFLDPALALRGEVRYRALTSGPITGMNTTLALLTLDPYLFGRASEAVPRPARFGSVDVSAFLYAERDRYIHDVGGEITVAPYLTRWAQVGVDAQGVSYAELGGSSAHSYRGFGRLYLPLTARTQPFAEGFAATRTFFGVDGGLASYGGALGVRQMLTARVGLDLGLRRTVQPATKAASFLIRNPGTTGLVAGLVTRLGR